MQFGDGHGAVEHQQTERVSKVAESATHTCYEPTVDQYASVSEPIFPRCLTNSLPERESLAGADDEAVDLATCQPNVVGLVLLQLRVDARSALDHVSRHGMDYNWQRPFFVTGGIFLAAHQVFDVAFQDFLFQ